MSAKVELASAKFGLVSTNNRLFSTNFGLVLTKMGAQRLARRAEAGRASGVPAAGHILGASGGVCLGVLRKSHPVCSGFGLNSFEVGPISAHAGPNSADWRHYCGEHYSGSWGSSGAYRHFDR